MEREEGKTLAARNEWFLRPSYSSSSLLLQRHTTVVSSHAPG
jgi:hypothetical protein